MAPLQTSSGAIDGKRDQRASRPTSHGAETNLPHEVYFGNSMGFATVLFGACSSRRLARRRTR